MWNSIYKHLRTLSGNMDQNADGNVGPLSPNTIMNNMSSFDFGVVDQDNDSMMMPLDHIHFENFHVLPDEVLLNIFQYMRRREIVLCIERVNKRFHELSKDEYLWWNLTFQKRGRNPQILDPTVCMFEQNPERESFVKQKLNCRDYFMEKVLVKKSCEAGTNKMPPHIFNTRFPVATPTSPLTPPCSASSFSSVGAANSPTLAINNRLYQAPITTTSVGTSNTPLTPTTPIIGGGSGNSELSPTTPTTSLKRKLRMAWKPMLSMGLGGTGSGSSGNGSGASDLANQTLFGHDRGFEKRMRLAQEHSTRMGHYNPHARHRHTITCTTPDESSFVMIGGFKNANNAAAQNGAAPQNAAVVGDAVVNEVEDSDVLHEFDTNRAHFLQVRIRTPSSPLTPSTIANQFAFPTSPLTPNTNAALFNASVGNHWMSNGANGNGNGPTTPLTPNTPTFRANNHTRTSSLTGKPMQFGKHSCVCVDNKKLFLFGGTEGENTVVTNNLYVYDLETKEWAQIEFAPDAEQPTARTNHQAALVTGPHGRKEMYVVGGGIGQHMTPTDEIWALDVEDYTWRQVPVKTKPNQKSCPFTARLGFTMHEVNNKLVIYGGGYWYQNGADKKWKEYYRELFIFDVKTSVWTNIDMTDCIDHVPRSGTFPVSCRVGAHLFVVGGGIVWDVSSEVNVLDLVTLKWRKLNSEQSYAADSSACITLKDYSENPACPKTKILLFGGYRYKPLSEYKVFAVRWKDFMTERGRSSLTRMEQMPGNITTFS